MILKGNQRGGAKDLALHLLKEENERIEVHEIRGFCSNTLMGALNESYAMSRALPQQRTAFAGLLWKDKKWGAPAPLPRGEQRVCKWKEKSTRLVRAAWAWSIEPSIAA